MYVARSKHGCELFRTDGSKYMMSQDFTKHIGIRVLVLYNHQVILILLSPPDDTKLHASPRVIHAGRLSVPLPLPRPILG